MAPPTEHGVAFESELRLVPGLIASWLVSFEILLSLTLDSVDSGV